MLPSACVTVFCTQDTGLSQLLYLWNTAAKAESAWLGSVPRKNRYDAPHRATARRRAPTVSAP